MLRRSEMDAFGSVEIDTNPALSPGSHISKICPGSLWTDLNDVSWRASSARAHASNLLDDSCVDVEAWSMARSNASAPSVGVGFPTRAAETPGSPGAMGANWDSSPPSADAIQPSSDRPV